MSDIDQNRTLKKLSIFVIQLSVFAVIAGSLMLVPVAFFLEYEDPPSARLMLEISVYVSLLTALWAPLNGFRRASRIVNAPNRWTAVIPLTILLALVLIAACWMAFEPTVDLASSVICNAEHRTVSDPLKIYRYSCFFSQWGASYGAWFSGFIAAAVGYPFALAMALVLPRRTIFRENGPKIEFQNPKGLAAKVQRHTKPDNFEKRALGHALVGISTSITVGVLLAVFLSYEIWQHYPYAFSRMTPMLWFFGNAFWLVAGGTAGFYLASLAGTFRNWPPAQKGIRTGDR